MTKLTTLTPLTLRFLTGKKPGVVSRLNATILLVDQAGTMAKNQGIERALGFLWTKLNFVSTFKELDIKTALLDKAKELFEEANKPEYYHWGLRFVSANYTLNRPAEAKALLSRIIGYTTSSADQTLRDKIRYGLVISCIEFNREEEAFQHARMIESNAKKLSVFRKVVEANIYASKYSIAENILLSEYLTLARAITGCELCPGKVDYTNRAEELDYIAGKLAEIGEATAEAEIRKEIKGLPGSYFIKIFDPHYHLKLLLDGRQVG